MAFYTTAFEIPSGGWTGGASAISCVDIVTPTTATGTTLGVKMWNSRDNDPLTHLTIRPGDLMQIKVRYVHYATGTNFRISGFN